MTENQKQDDVARWGADRRTRRQHCCFVVLVVLFLILYFCFWLPHQQSIHQKTNQPVTTQGESL